MDAQTSWYKGSLHMHSLWSDGDDYPDLIAARYKNAGYHFIAFTEHDRFQEGTPPAPHGHIRESAGQDGVAYPPSMALQSLSEYRSSVEEHGRFLILNGEEVTVNCEERCHWINVINALDPIGPIDYAGNTSEAIQSVVGRVERFDRPTLVSFNHPNYEWNATAEDLAAAEDLQFFEIYTALNCTRSYGDERRAAAERIWDVALGLRLDRNRKNRLFGIATDDSHRYRSADSGPFRAWVMVRAPMLTPEALIHSMSIGDFYASTGVTLAELEANSFGIHLTIEQAKGVNYCTRFIGTRTGTDMTGLPVVDENGVQVRTTKAYGNAVGMTLGEVEGPEAYFEFAGDEAYVRAVITSDSPHPRPTTHGEVMKAWTQPAYPGTCGAGIPRSREQGGHSRHHGREHS